MLDVEQENTHVKCVHLIVDSRFDEVCDAALNAYNAIPELIPYFSTKNQFKSLTSDEQWFKFVKNEYGNLTEAARSTTAPILRFMVWFMLKCHAYVSVSSKEGNVYFLNDKMLIGLRSHINLTQMQSVWVVNMGGGFFPLLRIPHQWSDLRVSVSSMVATEVLLRPNQILSTMYMYSGMGAMRNVRITHLTETHLTVLDPIGLEHVLDYNDIYGLQLTNTSGFIRFPWFKPYVTVQAPVAEETPSNMQSLSRTTPPPSTIERSTMFSAIPVTTTTNALSATAPYRETSSASYTDSEGILSSIATDEKSETHSRSTASKRKSPSQLSYPLTTMAMLRNTTLSPVNVSYPTSECGKIGTLSPLRMPSTASVRDNLFDETAAGFSLSQGSSSNQSRFVLPRFNSDLSSVVYGEEPETKRFNSNTSRFGGRMSVIFD